MDPIICLQIINDASEDADTRASHMHYLAEWLAKGGACPFNERLSRETVVFAQDSGRETHELAAALNCALINCDPSGLRGIGYEVVS